MTPNYIELISDTLHAIDDYSAEYSYIDDATGEEIYTATVEQIYDYITNDNVPFSDLLPREWVEMMIQMRRDEYRAFVHSMNCNDHFLKLLTML